MRNQLENLLSSEKRKNVLVERNVFINQFIKTYKIRTSPSSDQLKVRSLPAFADFDFILTIILKKKVNKTLFTFNTSCNLYFRHKKSVNNFKFKFKELLLIFILTQSLCLLNTYIEVVAIFITVFFIFYFVGYFNYSIDLYNLLRPFIKLDITYQFTLVVFYKN